MATSPFRRLAPGVLVCALGAAAAVLVNHYVPTVSALLVAIMIGAVLTNLIDQPTSWKPGIGFSAMHLLRAGIVLLGLQLVLSDIWALGWPVVLVVIGIVSLGVAINIAIGRAMGIGMKQAVLIACGFSICGAAAVAGIEQVVDADEKEVATAVALVVLFGTLMIPAVPLASHALGLGVVAAGTWAGGCIHEVAQVVAVGAALGEESERVAVVVKLARVAMLAPVAVVLGWMARRDVAPGDDRKRGPLVPAFLLGFLAMVLVASLHVLPYSVLAVAKIIQTWLLAAAMVGLGMGIRVKELIKVGGKPLLHGLLSTLVVAGLALAGVAAAVGLGN